MIQQGKISKQVHTIRKHSNDRTGAETKYYNANAGLNIYKPNILSMS